MPEKSSVEIDALKNDVRSLSSKIDLIIQKINNIEKNEQVLGRTVVTLNDKMKRVESGAPLGTASQAAAVDYKELDKRYASKEDVQELKYTLDMVNPLQFATVDQVREMISDAVKKKS